LAGSTLAVGSAGDGRDLLAWRELAGKALPDQAARTAKILDARRGRAGAARRHGACLVARATASAAIEGSMAIPFQPPIPKNAPTPVRFRLRDIQLPAAESLLATLWGDQVLEGMVVAHSRAAGDERCVVVKVPDLDQLIVVMATDLLTITEV
jgi:hypothetical protein